MSLIKKLLISIKYKRKGKKNTYIGKFYLPGFKKDKNFANFYIKNLLKLTKR